MSAAQIQVVNNFSQLANTTPYTTTSSTMVATGDNIILIPLTSTSVKVSGVINISSNTAADGVVIHMTYVQSATPIVAGTAEAGTSIISASITRIQNTANNANYIPITAIVSGLTIGLSYVFNMNIAALTGGTASMAIMQLVVEDY